MTDSKSYWRKEFKKRRRMLSLKRREEAEKQAKVHLRELLEGFSYILSYSSIGTELSLKEANQAWAEEGKLLLPRVEDENLEIYHVSNLDHDLTLSSWGILEPHPDHCPHASLSKISCVLLPGLGFDSQGHRLGYGKGFYDRLLPNCPQAKTFGICFSEQVTYAVLPTEAHDQALEKILSF